MKSHVLVRVATVGMIATLASMGKGEEVAFVPVSATGAHSISGNQIVVTPGAQVTLEIEVSDWTQPLPNLLATVEAVLDSSSLTSGAAGSLSPLIVPDPSAGAFIDESHPNYVFKGALGTITATQLATPNYRWAAGVVLGPVAPPVTPRYFATLILEVSGDASGTFTVEMQPPPQTAMTSNLGPFVSPLTVTPAQITVVGTPDGIPTVSEWGLIVMALLLLGGAKVYFNRRRTMQT